MQQHPSLARAGRSELPQVGSHRFMGLTAKENSLELWIEVLDSYSSSALQRKGVRVITSSSRDKVVKKSSFGEMHDPSPLLCDWHRCKQ